MEALRGNGINQHKNLYYINDFEVQKRGRNSNRRKNVHSDPLEEGTLVSEVSFNIEENENKMNLISAPHGMKRKNEDVKENALVRREMNLISSIPHRSKASNIGPVSSLSDAELEKRRLFLHAAIGHLSKEKMELAKKFDSILGLDHRILQSMKKKELECEGCIYGKSIRRPKSNKISRKENAQRMAIQESKRKIGEVLHCDVIGPINLRPGTYNENIFRALGQPRYVSVIVEGKTRKKFVQVSSSKNIVGSHIRSVIPFIQRQQNTNVLWVRSDGAPEYHVKKELKDFYEKEGIRFTITQSFSPFQNGIAERANDLIMRTARAMLHFAHLDLAFWGKAVEYAVLLSDFNIPNANDGKTIFEIWNKAKPHLKDFPIFGVDAIITILKEHRENPKVGHTGKKMIFIGKNLLYHAGYEFYDLELHKVINSSDAIFLSTFTVGRTIAPIPYSELQQIQEERDQLDPNELYRFEIQDLNEAAIKRMGENKGQEATPIRQSSNAFKMELENEEVVHKQGKINAALKQMIAESERRYSNPIVNSNSDLRRRTSIRRRIPPMRLGLADERDFDDVSRNEIEQLRIAIEEYEYDQLNLIPEVELEIDPEWAKFGSDYIPKSARIAFQISHWRKAMEDEMTSLEKNKTYVPIMSKAEIKGKKIIGVRWVFAIKRDEHGKIVRYKARLVVKGYSQIPGLDYGETFAPTLRRESFRILFAFANEWDYEIHQMDFETAFLNAFLKEVIFIQQPDCFEIKDVVALRLIKSLYGLKQAPENGMMKSVFS